MIQNACENSIVRSLSLELLSNLEDSTLQREIPSLINLEIEKIKSLVKGFLENRALNDYACFNSFSALLKDIEIISQIDEPVLKIVEPILFRHKKIIENERSMSVQQKPSHCYILRSAIYLDLFKPDINKTLELSKKLNFKLFPNVPKPTRIFNTYAWLDNINLLHSSYRAAGRWLFEHMEIFTFKDLCRSLKKSCHLMKDKLLNLGEYQIVTIDKKSQTWVAEIAYRFLPQDNPPSAVLKLEDNVLSADLFAPLFKSTCENFILFDDCAYTGTQFLRLISELYVKLTSGTYTKSESYCPYTTKRIFFIYGASAVDLNEIVKKYNFDQYNVSVECVTSYEVKNLKTLLSQEDLSQKLVHKIKKLVSGNKNIEGKQTLFTTEWKRPDAVSIPSFCLGRIPYYCSRVRTESKKRKVHEPELKVQDIYSLIDVTRFSGKAPITDVEKPYR